MEIIIAPKNKTIYSGYVGIINAYALVYRIVSYYIAHDICR